jgi:ABC-type dipeptide/oligopeptide/nickel transport system permease component
MGDRSLQGLPPSELRRIIDQRKEIEYKRLGLDKPFIVRSFSYLWDALTLNLGRAEQLSSDSGSRQVRLILLERLPATLLLFGTANLLLFFFSLFAGLWLSRRYGGFWDKFVIALTPTSAAPAWFYGHLDLRVALEDLALWGHGRGPTAQRDAPIRPQRPQAYDLAHVGPVAQLALSCDLLPTHVLSHLC